MCIKQSDECIPFTESKTWEDLKDPLVLRSCNLNGTVKFFFVTFSLSIHLMLWAVADVTVGLMVRLLGFFPNWMPITLLVVAFCILKELGFRSEFFLNSVCAYSLFLSLKEVEPELLSSSSCVVGRPSEGRWGA